MMKLYLHFEEENVPITVVLNVHNKKVTVIQLSKIIEEQFQIKGHTVQPNCQLCLYKQGPFKEKQFKNTDVFCDYLEENEEIGAKFIPYVKAKDKKPRASEVKMDQLQKVLMYRGDMKTKSMSDGSTYYDPKTVKDWLIMAEKWRVLGENRKTMQIYDGLIASGAGSPKMYEDMVKIYLDANRPKEAMQFLMKGESKFPNYKPFKRRLSDIYMAENEADLAIEVLVNYTKAMRKEGIATMEDKHEVQLALCKAYQLKEHEDMALVLIHGVIKELQETDGDNIPAVIEYAKLTYDLSPVQACEATRIVLHAFIGDKDNKIIQKEFSEMCRRPGALEHLYKGMERAGKDPAAIAFFANVIRSYGGIETSIEMFEKAMSMRPLAAQVILNYVHVLEILFQYEKAMKLALQYFQEYPDICVGSLCNKHLYQCVQHAENVPLYLYDSVSHNHTKPVSESLMSITSNPCVPDTYNDDDLYSLALWFTLVKILYIRGATLLLKPLINLLEPYYRNKDLHLTLIRNEAAFYACIAQLTKLEETTETKYVSALKDATASSSEDYIYLIGDSHCVTPAWKSIQYQNTSHIIHPLLSTGTKIWHIRPQSVFYPKVNFENGLKQIPAKATVIFLFGEIDCREAIVACYEKCIYDSIEEGIEGLINIYIGVLNQLYTKHKWTIYVHPVPPVLDITRDVVLVFNKMLGEKLSFEKNLHWLPIQDHLLDNSVEKPSLAATYEFDGTHLHPKYLSILEKELNNVHLPEDDPWDID